MNKYLNVIQIIISLVLIVLILLQQRGAGLSGVFGGEISGAYQTKRGLEKIVFYLTIFFAVLFLGLSILSLI